MTVPADAPILTAAAMREAEAACAAGGVSLAELMERAGAAVADTVWRMAAGAPILILCGPGNNGGDGYVAARLLRARGAEVRVAALGKPKTDLAKAARSAWTGDVEALDADTAPAPLVVDALFGAGLSRRLSDDLAALLVRFGGRRVVAVDLPSGVESDGGEDWMPALPAHVTVALGALKPAHVLLPTAPACGRTLLAGIGIDAVRTMRTLPPPPAPAGDPAAHKFSRGMVLVVAGPMKGAAELAAGAALRAGAGYVVLGGAARAPLSGVICDERDALAERAADARLGAIVVGPGYPAGEDLARAFNIARGSGKALVLDAAAIAAGLSALAAGERTAILTPHEGEFARSFPDAGGSKIERTLAAARLSRAVVVHKGADTVIAAPDGRVAAAWPGSPWLATAGTGDVLAGACGAMLARGGDAFDAAVAAVGWHIDRAARIGPGLVADDLIGK